MMPKFFARYYDRIVECVEQKNKLSVLDGIFDDLFAELNIEWNTVSDTLVFRNKITKQLLIEMIDQ